MVLGTYAVDIPALEELEELGCRDWESPHFWVSGYRFSICASRRISLKVVGTSILKLDQFWVSLKHCAVEQAGDSPAPTVTWDTCVHGAKCTAKIQDVMSAYRDSCQIDTGKTSGVRWEITSRRKNIKVTIAIEAIEPQLPWLAQPLQVPSCISPISMKHFPHAADPAGPSFYDSPQFSDCSVGMEDGTTMPCHR